MKILHYYFELLLSERDWSWTVIAIGYLFLTLVVRSAIFRHLAVELKQIDRGLYSSVAQIYLKKSLAGWFAFLPSLLLLIFLWNRGQDILIDRVSFLAFTVGIPLSFFSSLVLHLIAFSSALLTLLRQRMGVEREF